MQLSNPSEQAIITAILLKRVQGQALSADEQLKLDLWLAKDTGNAKVLEELTDPLELTHAIKLYFQTHSEEQLALVHARIARRKRKSYVRSYLRYAALFIGLLGGSYLIWHYNQPTVKSTVMLSTNDILPGTNKATLQLSTGKQIELDESHTGIINQDGEIRYADGSLLQSDDKVDYAVIQTPRAGHYQVELSDGTKVWLNAASKLVYPTSFVGDKREVKLSGEAYFDVAHDRTKPFIVHTVQQAVQVLGTSFAVRAYTTKELTTLLTGKVEVRKNGSHETQQLIPGQQAVLSQDGIVVNNVNVETYVAWMKGRIVGHRIKLEELAADIERWYDVDFVFTDQGSKELRAYINIDRNEPLSAVLKVLGITYDAQFKQRGKEVFVELK